MTPKNTRFEDRFLSKLGKIDRRRIREFVAQLVSRRDLFENIFNHLNEGIVVADERFRVLYANPFARRLLKWKGDRVGEDLAESCPPGELREALLAARDGGRTADGLECALKDRDERSVSLATMRLRTVEPGETEDSEPVPSRVWVALMQDVTERRLRVEEQARAHRLSSLALLTSGLAHEIKNPLNSIDIHAQILLAEASAAGEGGVDPEKVERAARVVREETERLVRIVDDFIQSARPQGATTEPQRLNRVVEDVARIFESECERAGIALRLDLDPDLPPQPLDARLLLQAIRNLVRNAIEAIRDAPRPPREEGDPEPEPPAILLRTRLRDDRAILEVADNGPGIPQEDLKRIFEPYYTTKTSGTGLGLMVVYRVVAEHGGELRVDSREGFGARFRVSLPLAERPRRLLGAPAAPEAEILPPPAAEP